MFENLKNNIDYLLREQFHFSRKNYLEINEEKDEINPLEKQLIDKYKLSDYRNNSTYSNYYQNLYLLNLLDKYFEISQSKNVDALDIGSKNWYYAQAMHSYYKKYSTTFTLDGVELDAHRLYSNFYNREEVAKYYIKNLNEVNYIKGNLLNINKSYDYITWILPFVVIQPLRCWGLPDKYFEPEKLFNHAYSLLKENGKMFIINQTEPELKAQLNIIGNMQLRIIELDNKFYNYKNKRYLTIIEKS